MKKKFLTTLVLFCSLALTACGGTSSTSSEVQEPEVKVKWESDKTFHWQINEEGEKIENAKHVFKEDPAQAVAATCSSEGKKVEVCEVCGYTKESKVAKSDHTWGQWVDKADGDYCGPSEQEHECSVCHTKATQTLQIKQHSWVKKDEIAASNGGVAYDLVECSACKKTAYMVAAAKGTINGSDKGGAPEGCIKLSNANETLTVAINVAEEKAGKIYLRGVMDYWHDGNNDNQDKSFSSVKSSSNTANFSLTVNGAAVDMSAVLNVKFGSIFPEASGETITNGDRTVTYSQMGDAKVGAVNLQAGLNTIVFTRIDSYNLAIHDFVIVF